MDYDLLVRGGRVVARGIELWFLRFVEKLLEGDPATSALLRRVPFEDAPPRFVRAHVYRYWFTDRAEQRATGAYWKRAFVGELLPPMSLAPQDFDEWSVGRPRHARNTLETPGRSQTDVSSQIVESK